MKKILLGLMMMFVSFSAIASQEIKICGGPPGLSYEAFASKIVQQTPTQDVTLVLEKTKGGMDNIIRVEKHECGYGIAPEVMVKNKKLPVAANLFKS
ncbi:MAG: hypothetical protein H7836_18180, partial [Magnetococcus sp. YQC-3]